MGARKLSTRVQIVAEMGIMAAAGFILDAIAGVAFKGVFPNGGSISIAMICVLIVAYRRGFLPALGVGIIMGLFDLMKGPYMIASTPVRVFFQLLLDYILAYPLVSLAAIMRKRFREASSRNQAIGFLLIGVLIGGFAKLLSHFLAGILFWADPSGFAWELTWMDPYAYCFIYNFAFTGPSIVLCAALLILMYLRSPRLFLVSPVQKAEVAVQSDKKTVYLSLAAGLVGLGVFVAFLVRYILSFQHEDYGEYGSELSFDRASLYLLIIGVLMMLFALNSFLNARKHYDFKVFPLGLMGIGILSLIANIAIIIRAKGEGDALVWTWFALSIAFIVAGLTYFFVLLKRRKKEEPITLSTENNPANS